MGAISHARTRSSQGQESQSDIQTLWKGIEAELDEVLGPQPDTSEEEVDKEGQGLDPNGYRGAAFADVALGVIPLQIALLVGAQGRVPAEALPTLFEQRFGVRVLEPDEKWLNRFAWSAAGLKFARWDETETVLLPGARKAEALDPPVSWTFAQVRTFACERHKAGARDKELFEQVLHALYPRKRAPRLMARIVGSAVYAAEHNPECE